MNMTLAAKSLFKTENENHGLFEKHCADLEKAIEAIHDRSFYALYQEMPLPAVYGENAESAQREKFEKQLNNKFDRLRQSSNKWLQAEEESPFSGKALGISYPSFSSPADFVEKASEAWHQWRRTDAQTRAGILMESLARIKDSFFEIAFSTMHTTGQAYMMSFQASGPHAVDRALEAIALGYQETTRFPERYDWEKPAGKHTVKLEKFCTIIPRGVSLAIGCSTFPVWNTLPGLYASLVTGNPVIVKPHPRAIYPVAIVVAILQEVLSESGFSPDLVLLAPDTLSAPLTKHLAENDRVRLIDFTGGSTFGAYVENLPGKITFTEKAGVNSVIIDSVEDLSAVVQNLAFSLCLYSGQMCTAPQNFFVPSTGIKSSADNKHLSYAEVEKALVDAVESLIGHPKMGPAVLGAIQSPDTMERLSSLKESLSSIEGAEIILESRKIDNGEFPEARTATPLLARLPKNARNVYGGEMFGPIAFVIATDNTDESLKIAAAIAADAGAISCGAYTVSESMMSRIAIAMADAGTSVSFNLTGNIYLNQNAGFSDFHVSGANPAGNASLTDPEFVVKRFSRVQARVKG